MGNSNNGVYVDSPSGVCAHTLGGNSWITLDLHSSHEIDRMEFVGRRGSCRGCYEQSSGWDIHIGNSGTSADPLCKSSVDVSGGDVSTVTCDSALTGHYITITSSNAMVLCEVDVYGRRNMPRSIIRGITATSDSYGFNGEAYKAVDGNSNNGVYVDSPSGVCAHTLGEIRGSHLIYTLRMKL